MAVLLDLRLCYSMVVFLELQAQLCVSLELDHLAHVSQIFVLPRRACFAPCDYVILSGLGTVDSWNMIKVASKPVFEESAGAIEVRIRVCVR